MRERVAQERGAADPVFVAVEGLREVRDVVAVAAYLRDGVQAGGVAHPLHRHQVLGVRHRLHSRPLLELHHHIGRLACDGVGAGQQGVHPVAGQRHRILDEDLDVPQARVEQGMGERGKTVAPRPLLTHPGLKAVGEPELRGQALHQRASTHRLHHSTSRHTQQRHQTSPGQHETPCAGGGMSTNSRSPAGREKQGSL
jgi:hypothetical protein